MVAGASATAAAAITAAVAVTWGGGAPSRDVTGPRHLAYAFHVPWTRSITLSGRDYLPAVQSKSLSTADSLHPGGRVPSGVYVLARYQAAANGDRGPIAVQWVKTTRQLAVSSQSGDRVDSPSRPVYFVVLHGHFVDENAYYMGGAARAPRGTVLSFTIDRKSGRVLDFALAKKSPDFSKLGRPQRFSFGSGRRAK
ncbi:MAG TPA: hypothetical protein VMU72_01410 [Gaiellaceae bacterium]|nr:hypothetical protein [Gaiellaceae bacterium]